MSAHPTRLDLEVTDGVAYMTLSGPPKNEMGAAFFATLSEMTRRELKHLQVRGLIIRGAGRHFSSGADVPQIESLAASDEHQVARLLEENIQSFLAISRLPFPVVAVIRGVCLGAGLELALACRYRVAEKNAVFSLPEVTYNIMPGCGGTVRLPKLIPENTAIELILTGRSVLADEALALGLVHRVVGRHSGEATALEMIRDNEEGSGR